MRLVADVDKQYKKLFLEAAKAAKARVQVDEPCLTEADRARLKLMKDPQNLTTYQVLGVGKSGLR